MKTDRSKPNEGTIVYSNPHSIPKTSKTDFHKKLRIMLWPCRKSIRKLNYDLYTYTYMDKINYLSAVP